MTKPVLAEYMRERHVGIDRRPQEIGPFITISREYGCHGFSLGLLLLDILNESQPPGTSWQIYHRDILTRLANETNLGEDVLQRELMTPPSLWTEFFRTFSREQLPTGGEILHRIHTIIRVLAIQGHAIVVGQGSAAATMDIPNGMALRIEAPLDWRVRQVSFREGLSESEARERIHQVEQERRYLSHLYEQECPRKPAYHMVYDASVFTLAQIAQSVVHMMQLRKMV